jgi:hypothetical protein
MAQLGLMPAQTNLQAGQIEGGYNQQVLDDNVAAWNFYQNLPWQMQQQYANLITGNVGSSGTGTQSGGGTSTSPLVGGFGGGLAGLSALGPLGLSFAANPVLAPLIVGGGALMGAIGNS